MSLTKSGSRRAIVLLSGGLDSTTALAIAQAEGFSCYGLSFQYGQRHSAELLAAKRIAEIYQLIEHKIYPIDLSIFKGSALTDAAISVPRQLSSGIPVTYVPARNTVFLSIALAWAEVVESSDIFIGVNAIDYSGYPDCRPEYIRAFQQMANLATKAAIDGRQTVIHTPLINLSKSEIIRKGTELGVDYALTVSCYAADSLGQACGQCDACRLRKQGFHDAGMLDPTWYCSKQAE